MKKSSAAFVGAVALALVMFVPSKASAQYGWGWGGGGVNIYVGPPNPYGYGYAYPPYGYGYAYPRYSYGYAIRVTAMADTTHTGVVTRGVPGGAGTRGACRRPMALSTLCRPYAPHTLKPHQTASLTTLRLKCGRPDNITFGVEQKELDALYIPCEACVMDRCYNCKQELIEIENDGLRLAGCLTCNLWVPHDGDQWVRLSEEDLRALHSLRHGGFR